MASAAVRNLHVPLPEALYGRLRAEAERTRRPATEIAREAIELWLSDQRRAAIHEAIASYARENAGLDVDLDPELEVAAVKHLVRARDGK